MRAKNAAEKIVEDFFTLLAAVLARLNLLSKEMWYIMLTKLGL